MSKRALPDNMSDSKWRGKMIYDKPNMLKYDASDSDSDVRWLAPDADGNNHRIVFAISARDEELVFSYQAPDGEIQRISMPRDVAADFIEFVGRWQD